MFIFIIINIIVFIIFCLSECRDPKSDFSGGIKLSDASDVGQNASCGHGVPKGLLDV
jgi:hypothetical protein